MEFVEVEFLMVDELKVAELALLEVQISQGKEKVNDADKVEFEFGKKDKKATKK